MGTNRKRISYALVAVFFGLILNALVASAPECTAALSFRSDSKSERQKISQTSKWAQIGYAPFCSAGNFIISHKDVIDGVSTLVIATFTILLAWSTIRLWRETERLAKGADDQSEKMTASISQAARAADAMKEVADSTAKNVITAANMASVQKDFWQMQMRAYLSVMIGSAIYQDRAKGLFFEAKPMVVNSGATPAHKVRHVIKAEILKVPLPDDFDFELPESQENAGPAIGPHQNRTYSFKLEDYVPDEDVPHIKAGTGSQKMLCVWGKVTYEDAFGEAHYANFAQILQWLPDGTVMGYYDKRHNNSN